MFGLSPAETAFVDALIETGDEHASAVIAGVQPALGRDARIQSALVDRLRDHGALDAVYARKVLRGLAEAAKDDGVRLRAASLLWERGLGKVPDTVNINVSLETMSRANLMAEIHTLIGEIGLPPLLEGEAEPAAHGEPLLEEEGVGSSPAAGTS